MMTQTNQMPMPSAGRGSRFLLALALVFALALALALMVLGPAAEVIFTNHARLSHAEQAINAVTIVEMIQAGRCKPRVYDCGANFLALCHLQNGNYGGVFYAADNGRAIIITGFQASQGFWERKTRGCSQVGQ